MEPNFLVEDFNAGSFTFSKPKRHKNGELMTCKIKNTSKEPVYIQFPKMNACSDFANCMEFSFPGATGYSKKVIAFLESLDKFILDLVSSRSQLWFDKTITPEQLHTMYKHSNIENKIKVVFDKTNSSIVDKKNEVAGFEEILKETSVQLICLLKYIVFTKDTCFLQWEVCKAKIYKKTQKVEHFSFIEDPDDESDDDDFQENLTFF
jgi:hypothetical protein